MKIKLYLVGMVFSLSYLAYPALADPALYSTDFSTDPGWVTDQPGNYYWDGPSQSYHVRAENHSPGYTPSRYAYKLLPEAVGTFELQWDVLPTRCDWSAGIFFGIYDDKLFTGGIPGDQSIQAGPGQSDGGNLWSFYISAAGGDTESSSNDSGWDTDFVLGRWYTCTLTYNAGTNLASFDVWDRESGSNVWSATLSVPGGFTNDLKYLGTARGGIGDDGTYPGLSPWAVAEGYIDNVVLFVPALEATIDIDPDTLNLKSKGKWITCYIELPEGYDVSDIDVSTVKLNDSVAAEPKPTAIGDYDGDGIADLMIKFDMSAVQGILQVGEVELTITGELTDGTQFEGSDTIRVINPGK